MAKEPVGLFMAEVKIGDIKLHTVNEDPVAACKELTKLAIMYKSNSTKWIDILDRDW